MEDISPHFSWFMRSGFWGQRPFGSPEAVLWEQEMALFTCHDLLQGNEQPWTLVSAASDAFCSLLWMDALTKKHPNLLIICKSSYIHSFLDLAFEAVLQSLKFCSSPCSYIFFSPSENTRSVSAYILNMKKQMCEVRK